MAATETALEAKLQQTQQLVQEGRTLSEVSALAAEYVDEENPEVAGPWQIQDLGAADWALQRLGQLQREIVENDALAEKAIARIMARREALNEKADRGVRFFESRLLAYAEANKAQLIPGKKRSRDLLHGRIGWKKKPAGLEICDEELVLAWARTQPIELGLIRLKEELARSKLKELFAANGELPDGCEPQPEVDQAYVTVKE